MPIINKIRMIPKPILSVLCALFALALGRADYLTGDLSILIFYFIPISVATWFIGRRTGLAISLLCGCELIATDIILQWSKGPLPPIIIWNSIVEAGFLMIAAHLMHLLKVEMDTNLARAQELEIANTELEAFNYSVAHDLRSPLTWIGGYSQLLLNRYGSNFDELHRDFLKRIFEGTLNMQQLIEALLDFSRVGRCELLKETVDLSAMAETISLELAMSDTGRSVKFSIEPGVTAHADKRLLNSVLRNLMGNAWKYSANKNDVIIEFGKTIDRGISVFYVRDNGIGFTDNDAEQLFAPFKRLETSEQYSGHGIGLATVHRIIQRHGGNIWAQGEPDKGATFYFSL